MNAEPVSQSTGRPGWRQNARGFVDFHLSLSLSLGERLNHRDDVILLPIYARSRELPGADRRLRRGSDRFALLTVPRCRIDGAATYLHVDLGPFFGCFLLRVMNGSGIVALARLGSLWCQQPLLRTIKWHRTQKSIHPSIAFHRPLARGAD